MHWTSVRLCWYYAIRYLLVISIGILYWQVRVHWKLSLLVWKYANTASSQLVNALSLAASELLEDATRGGCVGILHHMIKHVIDTDKLEHARDNRLSDNKRVGGQWIDVMKRSKGCNGKIWHCQLSFDPNALPSTNTFREKAPITIIASSLIRLFYFCGGLYTIKVIVMVC